MNMRVPMIVIAAFWICTFSACKRSANKANVRTLDSLMAVTENLLTEMNAMDRDPLHAIDSSDHMRKATLELVMRDTLDKRSAIALGSRMSSWTAGCCSSTAAASSRRSTR